MQVLAQAGAPAIVGAELRLWPEYDDPGLLVIFAGTLAEGTATPVQLILPIAPGARNIQATFMDASGTLINRTFEVKDNKLTYEVPSTTFHVEYYVDRAPSAEQRNIDFAFEAPYSIQDLQISIQQPARATEFSVQPAPDNSTQGPDGLTYQWLARKDLAAGQQVQLNIRYTKPDSGLTAPQLAVTATESAAAAAAPAARASSGTNLLPWLLIGLGAALLAGILAYWLLGRRHNAVPDRVSSPPPVAERRRPAPGGKPLTDAPAGGAAGFCTQCGAQLRVSDRFCPQCGTRRRP